MRHFRALTSAVTVAALMGASVTPALAREHGGRGGWGGHGGYGGGYHGGGYRHRHDDFDFGDAVGIIALIGAVAVIASAASKNADSNKRTPRSNGPDGYNLSSEDEAVNACADAARDKAQRDGGYAEVTSVDEPTRSGDEWRVSGRIERRDTARDRGGDTQRFSCTVRNGRVAEVALSGGAA